MSYNHSTQAFSQREAGSEAGKQSLSHLKPWFRQSEETLMFGIQLRPHETPHGAKTTKSKPKVLTNSRYSWGGKQGGTQTNFYQQQKEQDTVKTAFTSEVLLTLCRQGRSFAKSLLNPWQYPQDKIEVITKKKAVFNCFKHRCVEQGEHMAVIQETSIFKCT